MKPLATFAISGDAVAAVYSNTLMESVGAAHAKVSAGAPIATVEWNDPHGLVFHTAARRFALYGRWVAADGTSHWSGDTLPPDLGELAFWYIVDLVPA